MNKKTLLVLGSVTAAQYNDARLRMMREGVTAQVVRVEPDDFLLNDMMLIEQYLDTPKARDKALSMEPDEKRAQLVKGLIVKHLRNFSYPLGAIIMDRSTWEIWRDDEFVFLTDALNVEKWVVHENGQVEYVG